MQKSVTMIGITLGFIGVSWGGGLGVMEHDTKVRQHQNSDQD